MENTQHPLQLEAEIAQLLHENPAAAHFMADLAGGTDLKQAVADHFGELLDAPAADGANAPGDTGEITTEPATQAAQPPQPAPMYAPVGIGPADAASDDCADDTSDTFMLFAPSVWD